MFIVLAVLSLLLMFADQKTDWLRPVRQLANTVLLPVHIAAGAPGWAMRKMDSIFSGRNSMLAETERLQAENLVLNARVQKLTQLMNENMRLRSLVNTSAFLSERVLVAEIMGIDPDPSRHRLLVNKGASNGVFEGQPILDPGGVVGQVVEVNEHSAWVLMISDRDHRIPVKVARNGYRAIAQGEDRYDEVTMPWVTMSADIRPDDLLVTSGLGGRFPEGYPVGTVTKVKREAGHEFTQVMFRPAASLETVQYLLMLFNDKHQSQWKRASQTTGQAPDQAPEQEQE
jgi:rod shape-determining protein MreC